ncbi:uncharacterized protein RAG0_17124 [Rhynchosporium agropyri]|uniref:Uncharacterized protein n=1 Tax=Rhynchosporium agropyri TaxID=914238 RepID=A0A1E1LT04_9HELO|nr:uncharacterized protein RAG0_17124 [Rhynchosporium agropyri]
MDMLVPYAQKLSAKYAPWSKDTASFWRSEALTIVPEETHCHPLRFIYEAKLRIQYEDQESYLNREIAGVETIADDVLVSTLRGQVKAGRRNNKLTERFCNGILLVIPSSIGRSTLEQKLPLGKAAFDEFVSPVVGDWEKCAKTESIANLGASIRQSLLERCLIQRAQSYPRATKRKTRGPSPQSKKQKKRPENATV